MIAFTDRWDRDLQTQNRPRDVICRLHHYCHKESITRKAWEAGDFDGVTVKILPDVSRATLQRRATLRQVLELAHRQDATYRWGYPLSVIFRRNQRSFTLRSPSDLPGLLTFLEADPIRIPNWLMFLPQTSN